MRPYNLDDTITAIATPPGRGAIGVIKLSGELALPILKKIFKPAKKREHFESHRFYYGFIVDPNSGEKIDEVLVVYMKKPHSYTREDVVEIHGHSGYYNLRKILELVIREGARPAEPGEFTLRAFLNGRIDLSQAEAIEEIISAKSDRALQFALNILSGKLSERINTLRQKLLHALAQVESAIDFPEEDIEIMNPPQLINFIRSEIIKEIEILIENYREGRIYREGINLVISGKPNVGKSSLMNALLREERAIVTPIPGTTRDFLEEEATIRGLPVKLIDTAGLRETEDPVEKIGVERALQKLKEADLVLFLVDAGESPKEEDFLLFEKVKNYPHLIVINKIDLSPNYVDKWRELFSPFEEDTIPISVKENLNLDQLSQKIFDRITQERVQTTIEVAPNLRQKLALEKAKTHLEEAITELIKKEPLPEVVSLFLRDALNALTEIIGEVTTEDLLSEIFSKFCIGK